MRLASFYAEGESRIGFAVGDNSVADLTMAYTALLKSRDILGADQVALQITPPEMTRFIELGSAALAAAREAAAYLDESGVKTNARGAPIIFKQKDIKWRAPVPKPPKIFCVVLNNAELSGLATQQPDHPLYFSKPTSCLTGHLEPIEIPDIGPVHPESELAVIIGKRIKRIKPEDAFDAVYGYSIFNDVTAVKARYVDVLHARVPMTDPKTGKLTLEELIMTPMARHKGYDTFAPMGPFLVTKDEVPDPHLLSVKAWMGKELVNEDHTGNYRFMLPRILEHITSVVTLEPGDIVTMGTASSTEKWPMRDANITKFGGPVRIEIESLGVLENPVVNV